MKNRKGNKHQYLKEIFPDELPFPFNEKGYPDFDVRDTYNLDTTLIVWLYERLRYFQEHTIVDLDYKYRLWEIGNEKLTLQECINRIIDNCRIILKANCYSSQPIIKAKDDLFDVLSKVFFALWW